MCRGKGKENASGFDGFCVGSFAFGGKLFSFGGGGSSGEEAYRRTRKETVLSKYWGRKVAVE